LRIGDDKIVCEFTIFNLKKIGKARKGLARNECEIQKGAGMDKKIGIPNIP
jgi:hypothetical protein